MLASRRNCACRAGSGTSSAKPLHSAAKRMHISAYFLTLNSDIALLLKGGSACISQSSAGQYTVPVMESRWGRVGHLTSVIFSNRRARSRHHRSAKAERRRFSPFNSANRGPGTAGPIAIRAMEKAPHQQNAERGNLQVDVSERRNM